MPELKARRLGIVGSCGLERELEETRDPALRGRDERARSSPVG